MGFIIQDLGARVELAIDNRNCKRNKEDKNIYKERFYNYLFNKRQEEYIVTHYYRAMLIRMKFELHTIVAIVLFWLGMIARWIIEEYSIDLKKTIIVLILSLSALLYLLYEAISGAETLNIFREDVNKKFNPYKKPI